MVKLVIVFRKHPELSDGEFADCLKQHGVLVAKHAQTLGIQRYVQSVRVDSELVGLLPGGAGSTGPDGMSELWWASESAMGAAFASPEGQAALAELGQDVVRLADVPTTVSFLSTEHVVVDAG